MKRLIATIFITSVLTLSLSACSNMKNRDVGTLAGGATGAVAGNLLTDGSAVGTAAGAVGGGVAGHYIGKNSE